MKKGQIEMIGLVIVVIILIIGGLLYLRFGVLGKKEVKKEAIVETAYLVNTLNSILNVKVCSNTISIQDGLTKCFEEGQNLCGGEACDYLKDQIKDIITSVGLNDKYKYSFYIEMNNEAIYINQQCEYGSKADIKVANAEGETYTANLQIC